MHDTAALREAPPVSPPECLRTATGRYPLSVRGLSYSADGQDIIKKVSFDLPSDDLTVLMGPNGAGKSVLLRLLHGLMAPTGGTILWNGRPIDRALRKSQAMVFQKPVLLRRSVLQNLRFAMGLRGLARSRGDLEPILKRLHLQTLADRPARLLSGGEQQRLSLARALALKPEILFLDEPCANLDPASVQLIEDTIKQAQAQGTKIILVTHDIHQARRLAEQVVFLHHGQVSEITPADIFFNAASSREARAYLDGKILI
ncbi:ATP-binding cassette domain-containing protein [Rhizobiales bacterium]|uniref:ATP-binding cassette domain-containing protein n=1 Tax=Hongsoonwoonella zoysiae TaxID=2821844 RepID=UPI001560085C|nr:ATP-binding cassette domain-containing protein [Hongsoonwoonella zoysiae]NRG19087.1 ATP-binding cassette domain-containing protein [Hongsoonwoonella zoysiae]